MSISNRKIYSFRIPLVRTTSRTNHFIVSLLINLILQYTEKARKMEIQFTLTVLCLLELNLQTRSDNNKCVNNKEVSCCTGYYMYEENMTCLACIGAWGQNCSIPCSSGFYGRLCKSRCLCPENQCDKLTGCVKDNGRTKKPKLLDDIKKFIRRHWSIIPILVLLLLFVIICSLLVYITRKKNRIRRSVRSRRRSTDYTHTLPLDPLSDYQHMISCTPHISTEYINTFSEYINASTECLNASFQLKPVDDISGAGYI